MSEKGAAQAKLRQLSRVAYVDWFQGQGAKIRANRPQPVADHCTLMAIDLAKTRRPLILKAEEILLCEQRAVSQARVAKFHSCEGLTEDQWRAQIEQIKAEWQINVGVG